MPAGTGTRNRGRICDLELSRASVRPVVAELGGAMRGLALVSDSPPGIWSRASIRLSLPPLSFAGQAKPHMLPAVPKDASRH
jgi:hypothetical protein